MRVVNSFDLCNLARRPVRFARTFGGCEIREPQTRLAMMDEATNSRYNPQSGWRRCARSAVNARLPTRIAYALAPR